MVHTQRPEKETAKAARAFELYCTMNPEERSLRHLAERLWKERGGGGDRATRIKTITKTLGIWSKEFRWQDRVKAYDKKHIAAEAERRRLKRERELEVMNDEHIKWGRAMAGLAMKKLNDMANANGVGSQAAVLLFREGVQLERLARGAATEQTRLEVSGIDGGAIKSESQVLVVLPKKGTLL